MQTLRTGADVDALCSRCRLELAHVIVALDGSRIVRVQCKTCGTIHSFKSSSQTRGERKTRSASGGVSVVGRGRGAAGRAAAALDDYESLMEGRDLSRAKRYKPAVTFGEGDVVDHATFGIGLITKLLADNKVEVVFRQGLKVLAHGR
jgi:hypothetical protein